MNDQMKTAYGKENSEAFLRYVKDYIPLKNIATPKELPVGTILTQRWLNSVSFYKVTRTTKKGVELKEIPTIQVSFENESEYTGYSYILPDFVRMEKEEKEYAEFSKEYGDILNDKKAEDLFWKTCEAQENDNQPGCLRNRYWNFHYSKKVLKIVKFTDGGFNIPGVRQGNFCEPMKLWSGDPKSEYYC